MEITAEHMIAPTSAAVMLGPTSNNFAHACTQAHTHTHIRAHMCTYLYMFSLPVLKPNTVASVTKLMLS